VVAAAGVYLRHFTWPAGSRRWLLAFAGWGAMLLITALFTFLPGVLDRWKFTNALVAHTHIAMAGMLTCFLC
jgi:cytochrome c oxidase cbb3-type subunit 1